MLLPLPDSLAHSVSASYIRELNMILSLALPTIALPVWLLYNILIKYLI